MDIYGVSVGIRACARIYFQGLRATGRTTHMISQVENGDLIIFHTNAQEESKRVLAALSMRGVRDVQVGTANSLEAARVVISTFHGRRIHLDHSFVDALYMETIESVGKNLNSILARSQSVPQSPAEFHPRANHFRF